MSKGIIMNRVNIETATRLESILSNMDAHNLLSKVKSDLGTLEFDVVHRIKISKNNIGEE